MSVATVLSDVVHHITACDIDWCRTVLRCAEYRGIERRPDIQQAERELAAATARIGVATASLFPDVTVSGSIGSQGQGWGTLPGVGKHIWSFGPGGPCGRFLIAVHWMLRSTLRGWPRT
jgi:hypothetical protein